MVFHLGKYLFVGQMFCMAGLPLLCGGFFCVFFFCVFKKKKLYTSSSSQ